MPTNLRKSPSGPEVTVATTVTSSEVSNLANSQYLGPTVTDALETLSSAESEALGNSGAAITIDFDESSPYKSLNVSQNTTVTLDLPTLSQYLQILVTNNGTFTVTFTNTIKWRDNTAYVASGTDADLLTFYWDATLGLLLGSWGSYGT
jgi:hypothetical protein